MLVCAHARTVSTPSASEFHLLFNAVHIADRLMVRVTGIDALKD